MDQENLKLTGLKMEYSFLSEQIIKRFEMRQKIIQLTLTIAAAFLGAALTKNVPPSVALVFPPIAALIEIEWFYLEKRQMQTIKYLRKLEKKIPELELSWENFKDLRMNSRFHVRPLSGIFLFSQLMAVFIGVLIYDTGINNWSFNYNLTVPFILLLFIDLVSILITLKLVWKIRSLHNA